MSFHQTQITADYYSALADTNNNDILEANKRLNFMAFPVVGSANTYDSSSFCPDSASTATSLSTGHKTYSGTINMDETFTTEYETITEKLKNIPIMIDRLDWAGHWQELIGIDTCGSESVYDDVMILAAPYDLLPLFPKKPSFQ